MSGVVKAVKKVFKKVVKVVKKIAVPVLAAGAVFFTAGAALGALPAWGAAVSGASASMGLTGTLGSVVSGAVTQAGVGAAIGGTISAATGGSFSKGAQAGAITGAVTGGVGGLLRSGGAAASTASAQPPLNEGLAAGQMGPPAPAPGMGPPVPSGAGSGAGAGTGGLLSRTAGWVERNQELVGHAVRGVGQGLMAGAEADAQRDLIRERHNLTSSNYAGTDPGAGYRNAAPGASGQTPTQRWDSRIYGSWEYAYNPKTGRIERVPLG